ncbi:microtubule-associated protein 1S-like [Dermacentor silvarum]|uniref:microtubule-associated protein 1S-like n=1 Tax=Dermacentor silvarum TaxID=543639 RepID=UPI0018971AAC|nr:microtubule-associated protein 1S-like [Dermacentor silvarum]
MTRDSGAIADPTPAPGPHAIGSATNDVASAVRASTNPSPNSSTLPAERASESAHEPCPVPTPLPPTVSAVATPRNLPASESDAAAAAATFFPAQRSSSSPSVNLPLGLSSDYSAKSEVDGCAQSARDEDTSDGLPPPSRDASLDGVSHPPPDPVLRVVATLALAKQHDPAPAAPALRDLRQPAPVPSSSVVRRRLPARIERYSHPRPLTVARPRLRPARPGPSSLDSGGVARRCLQLATSTIGRANPEKRALKPHPPELTHLRARNDRASGLSCPPMTAHGSRSFRQVCVNCCRDVCLHPLRAGLLCTVRPQRQPTCSANL